jgi:hypothetical protein
MITSERIDSLRHVTLCRDCVGDTGRADLSRANQPFAIVASGTETPGNLFSETAERATSEQSAPRARAPGDSTSRRSRSSDFVRVKFRFKNRFFNGRLTTSPQTGHVAG